MTPEDRTRLVTQVKESPAGRALCQHLSLEWQKLLVELTNTVNPMDTGRVGYLQGAIQTLVALEAILEADFEETVTEMQEKAA